MTSTAQTSTTARRVTLAQHRAGTEPATALVAVDQIDLPAPGPGQALVRTTHVQVAAVMADLMGTSPNLPMPGYAVGQPVWGAAVGQVVASGEGALAPGTMVLHMQGWQDHVLTGPWEAFPLDPTLPAPYYGLNQGVTALHGIVDIAEVGEGDVVFVSGAAGGVGSLAGQIARTRGATTVIGSAGGPAKCAYLVEELGYDAAVDHRGGDLLGQLRAAAPDGIDVFFDTVAGDQFEAAVHVAAQGARFALCGALAGQLEDSAGAHPRLDVMTAIRKELRILPFSTMHTPEQLQAWHTQYGPWLADGSLRYPHTLVPGGLDAAAATLDDLLAGVHRGTVVVEL